MKNTLVTGLWDIGRGSLSGGWSRSFDHYLSKFKDLLNINENLIVFGEAPLKDLIFDIRKNNNTQFIERKLSWFKNNEFFESIQKIRKNKNWINQASWLKDSTQASLEMYNPIVMSKVFLLNDARLMDKFDSDNMFWIDAGISNTVHCGYFEKEKVIDKIVNKINEILFIAFPYEANKEIHGFDYNSICQLCNSKVNRVCRGGFFGGPKHKISQLNSDYYEIMKNTLSQGLMGTEESLFTILSYVNNYSFTKIENNGLIGKFFEDVKNNNLNIEFEKQTKNIGDTDNTGLYVITFNSPNQFKKLAQSMKAYDENFIIKPKKFLLNNSLDLSTTKKYENLCLEYNFEHIKKDNLGICGGRQFIAEHAAEQNFDFYMFFEDDMLLYSQDNLPCKNGFQRKFKDLYNILLTIMKNYEYDFLKLSFTEFYGDNSTQWSWYNVPQDFRKINWPNNNILPEQGLSKNAPKTEFKNIYIESGLPFIDGEVYYSNWPQVISKEGNKKIFLTDKWAHPYEQTWMSYVYQKTITKNIKSAILLASVIEHNRFEHYAKSMRKES
jgi:hypothetical protein